MNYVLASKSPRRKELMKEILSSFIVDVSDIDEESSYNLSPIEAVKDIAFRKGEAVSYKYPDDIVISADTIVVHDNKIIGKPVDIDDAKRILTELSGEIHYVYTGYAIHYKDKVIIGCVESKVEFHKLSSQLIEDYAKTGSPLDKAGAYGVQDNDKFPIIKKVIGSIDNVIGFPVKEIKEDIRKII